MYYRSENGTCCCTGTRQTFCVHSPGGSTFLTSRPPMSNQISDSINRCAFSWRTVLPNFIPMRFQTTEPWAFFEEATAARRRRWWWQSVSCCSRSSVEQSSIARHCCPLSLHLLLSSLNHISSHFLIPLSDSSLICTVLAQWLVILDTIIAFTLNVFKHRNNISGFEGERFYMPDALPIAQQKVTYKKVKQKFM